MNSTMNNCHCTSSLQWFIKYCQALGLDVVHSESNMQIIPLTTKQYDTLSFGKVTSPLMINPRTNSAEKDGLYCERIFNSKEPYTCYCGKYKKKKVNVEYACDRCGVTLADSDAYYKHQGHIHLATAVIHPFMVEYLAPRMNLSVEKFRAMIYDMLEQDSQQLFAMLRKYDNVNDMILRRLLVPPAGFRPQHQPQIEDINTLYAEVIKQNHRLKHFIDKEAAAPILRIETAALQRKVDQLFMNESLKKPFTGYGKKRHTYTSLWGYMRKYLQNFFQHATSFSQKHTATYDPTLQENQCGVPLQQLLLLYKNFITQFRDGQKTKNVEIALQYLDFYTPVVDDILRAKSPEKKKLGNSLHYHHKLKHPMKSNQQITSEVVEILQHLDSFATTLKSLMEYIAKCPIVFSYKSVATALYATPLLDRRTTVAFSERTRRELHLKFAGEKVRLFIPRNEDMQQEARDLVGKYTSKKFTSSFSYLANLSAQKWSELAIGKHKIPLQDIDNTFVAANQITQ
ncbi:hypothetical protein [Candidatus Uabimicrobium amorphum]|uniref:DNA-directed RNA polymerase subunit n=1 Tax=Uabimicrobium amorphum TaxID=2596890 RepID=A0A5S9IJB4_UABAM|nr:hypothetical protein [Candidatus Uabimicrobium amorphum]BBM82432.1 DNA-directed RNA polymerase subunit beta' [Candidatus Uabimicrobium amorphum]